MQWLEPPQTLQHGLQSPRAEDPPTQHLIVPGVSVSGASAAGLAQSSRKAAPKIDHSVWVPFNSVFTLVAADSPQGWLYAPAS